MRCGSSGRSELYHPTAGFKYAGATPTPRAHQGLLSPREHARSLEAADRGGACDVTGGLEYLGLLWPGRSRLVLRGSHQALCGSHNGHALPQCTFHRPPSADFVNPVASFIRPAPAGFMAPLVAVLCASVEPLEYVRGPYAQCPCLLSRTTASQNPTAQTCPRFCSAPVLLVGADPWGVAAGSMLGGADRCGAGGGIEAVAASWTIGHEDDGPRAVPRRS